jgi:superfamily II DNA or RNA helicase
VASYGTTSTGVSIKNIHNVIFASPSKSKIKVLQSIGRGLRKNENKDRVVLYDIVDKISYTTRQGNEKTNYVFHHFLERWKIYKHEGFNYKIHSRKIK